MRAIVQRVKSASVEVEGQRVSSIGHGFLVLAGIRVDDTEKEAEVLAQKLVNLRVFDDPQGKMNLSIREVSGSLLVVSQFTLYADTQKGRRPGFQNCAPGPVSKPLYEKLVKHLKATGVPVEEGVFGAHMLVRIENDGPVTFVVEASGPPPIGPPSRGEEDGQPVR